ncbi:UspA domain-containing protein [Caballeronia choica]|jgi:nucleotide-binding universal stress UspA family protein|uniref:UspA domain-containing protein n=1 Tax=Caballeronia choica TaxID=326476 RepID=A0A158KCS5_9BURK|nr:UspA domain-containing protein [Caballeronia choica]
MNAIEDADDASIGYADADSLVMGACGHARWRELVPGEAVRTVLKSSTLPVLL